MNTNFKDIGLTRLGIKPESTAPKEDALTTRQSELSNFKQISLLTVKKFQESCFQDTDKYSVVLFSKNWFSERKNIYQTSI